jgi:hypothetical protein
VPGAYTPAGGTVYVELRHGRRDPMPMPRCRCERVLSRVQRPRRDGSVRSEPGSPN